MPADTPDRAARPPSKHDHALLQQASPPDGNSARRWGRRAPPADEPVGHGLPATRRRSLLGARVRSLRRVIRRKAAKVRGERGSGTLLAVGIVLGVLSAAVVGVLWAAVSIGHHRVDAAADLVALSAAQALQSGDGDACRTAERIAVSHAVDLTGCRVEAEMVTVAVGLQLRLGALGTPLLRAEARAGPVGGD